MDIININVGQAGINIGNSFLQTLAQQHKINSQPEGHPHVFFRQNSDGFIPRSISLDMDDTFPAYQTKKYPKNYDSRNILCENRPSFGIFGESTYKVSSQFIDSFEDRIRSQFELSDKIGGFIMIGSLGGGAGSGLLSLLQYRNRQKYPQCIAQTFRLLPSINRVSHPIQIYNTVFGIHYEIQQTNMTVVFDNDAITKMLTLEGKTTNNFQAMNNKMGKTIANSTIPFSFKGDLNTSQRKIVTNMVFFPRLHFLTLSQSSKEGLKIFSSLFDQNNCFLSNFLGKNPSLPFFSIYAGVRSHIISQNDIYCDLRRQFTAKNYQFLRWIPDNIHLSLHSPIEKEETTLFMNSNHIQHTLKDIRESFKVSLRRNAFLHRYTECGMDWLEFNEALSNLQDLEIEYGLPQDLQADYDGN